MKAREGATEDFQHMMNRRSQRRAVGARKRPTVKQVLIWSILIVSFGFVAYAAVPSVPSNLRSSVATTTSFTLAWDASTGAPTSYDVIKAGTTLTPSATTTSYNVTGLTACTSYSMTVKSKNASGSSAASSALVVWTLPNSPTLSSSNVTSVSAKLTWTKPAGGTPAGYDIYKSGVKIDSTTTALTYTLNGLTPGTAYSYTVQATNSAGGSSAASNTASFTTSANVLPTVSLTAPSANTAYTLPTSLGLTATASDTDGTVSKVEFFNGPTKLGEALSSPYSFTWTPNRPGAASLTAKATDNFGGTKSSAAVPVRILPSVPYTSDFETAEGFTTGNLNGQLGWSVVSGSAQVVASGAANGTQKATLSSNNPATEVDQEFGPVAVNPQTVYVDLFAKPVAGSTYVSGTIFDLDSARVAFVVNGSVGKFAVLNGDGQGDGVWKDVGSSVAVDGASTATAWQRLTVRLDYVSKKYDFYVNGALVAYDQAFRLSSASYFSWFSLKGHTSASVSLDDIFVGAANPLFTDSDDDGMDDSWESAHGLNIAANDRSSDSDGDGLSNIQEYMYGTDPAKADSDSDGLNDALEVHLGSNPTQADNPGPAFPVAGALLHLRGEIGVFTDTAGHVERWADASGQNNDATSALNDGSFQRASNQLNGFSVVQASAGADRLILPNFIDGAPAGEIFGVVRVDPVAADTFNSFWNFGRSYGTAYFNSDQCDDFGSSIPNFHPAYSGSNVYHLVNVSSAADGNWISRINGGVAFQTKDNVVAYRPDPTISAMNGAIAELVVFDHVLSASDREKVGQYFEAKYNLVGITLPTKPVLHAVPLSSSKVDLYWSKPTPALQYVATNIERKIGTDIYRPLATVIEASTFTDTGLSLGQVCSYRITQRTYAGDSIVSDPVSLTVTMTADEPPAAGLQLWLRASAGVPTPGPITRWLDQSLQHNDALQLYPNHPPQLVADAATNNQPVIRFDGASDRLSMSDVMKGTSDAEIFAVLKPTAKQPWNVIWNFGGDSGYNRDATSRFFSGFGLPAPQYMDAMPDSALLQYHIINTSISAGTWIERFNGIERSRLESVAPAFNPSPSLGNESFEGDFGEILVYNRALTTTERTAVYTYLAQRFAVPTIVPPNKPALYAYAVSATKVDLNWTEATSYAQHVTAFIERKTSGGAFQPIAQVDDSTSYVDTTTLANQTYVYQIKLVGYGGSSPFSDQITVTTLASDPATTGLRLWLRASASNSGPLKGWKDQSGSGTHLASIDDPSRTPKVILNAVNGKPVVRFDGDDQLYLDNVMNGATAGEIIAVVKVTFDQDRWNTLWSFGTAYGSNFINADKYEDFGTNETNVHPATNLSTQYFVTDVSITSGGAMVEYANGASVWQRTGAAVSFVNTPSFGGSLLGDIAEVFVYDRVLTSAERTALTTALGNRYAIAGMADTSIPSTPTGLSNQTPTITSFVLNWNASTDNVGVTSYDIYKDNVLAGNSLTTSFSVTGLSPNTNYSMTVRARDAAGNQSNASSALGVKTAADAAAPSVPTGLSAAGKTATSFVLNWNPSTDNVGVTSYVVYKNGTSIGTPTTNSYTVTGLTASTTYNMTVAAKDGSGNTSAQSSPAYPVTTLSSDTTAPTAPTNVVVGAVTATSIALTWTASTDNVAVTGYDVLVDGISKGNPTSTSYTITGLAASTTYSITIKAKDAAGNVSTASTAKNVTTVTPDTQNPTVPANLQAIQVATTSFTLTWDASTDNVAVTGYDIFKNGALLDTATTNSYSVTGLTANTTYLMTVQAKDAAGNKSAVSAQRSVTTLSGADVTAPSIPTAPYVLKLSSTGFTISWTPSTDNVGVTSYDIYNGVSVMGNSTTSTFTSSALPSGTTYSISIKAKDAAGNSSPASAALSVTTDSTTLPVAGLSLWLRPDAGIAPGNSVSTWVDQTSAGNNATQSNSAQNPALVTNASNGKPVVRFDGIDDNLSIPPFLSSAVNVEIILVTKALPRGNDTWTDIFNYNGGLCYYRSPASVNSLFAGVGGANVWGPTVSDSFTSDYHILSTSIGSGVLSSTINGVEWARANGITPVFTGNPTIGYSLKGDIAEIVVYNRSLSSTERDNIFRYLTQKYAPPGIVVPTKPTLTATEATSSKVDLSWGASNGQHITTAVERKVGAGSFTVIATVSDQTTYTDATTSDGQTYTYRIQQTSYAGTSPYSDPSSVTITTLTDPPVSGLQIWLRSTSAQAGSVAVWADQSGKNNNASQANVAQQPVAVLNAVNGKPVIRFDGVGSSLIIPDVLSTGVAGEVVALVKVDSKPVGSGNELFFFGGGSAGYVTDPSGNTTHFDGFGIDVTPSVPALAPQTIAQYHVFDCAANNGSLIDYINGVVQLSVSGKNKAFSTSPALGRGLFKGDFAEILVYNRALTSSERDAITQYLARKYSVSDFSVPAAPSLAASSVSSSKVDLTWTPPQSGTQHIASLIERKVGSGTFAVLTTLNDMYSYVDATVAAGQTYTYRVKLQGYLGNSPYSNDSTVTSVAAADPSGTAGLRLWLRSTIGVNGPLVSSWLDQSGNGNNAVQTDASHQPTLVAAAANGRPVVRFDGLNGIMFMPDVMKSATQGEVFIVAKVLSKTGPSYNELFNFGSGTGYSRDVNQKLQHYNGFGLQNPFFATPPSDSSLAQYHILNTSYTGTTAADYFNGALLGTSNGQSTFWAANPSIGGQCLLGDVAELLVYSRALTQAERDAINVNLYQRYAIPAIVAPGQPVLTVAAASSTRADLAWTIANSTDQHIVSVLERKTGTGAFVEIQRLDDKTFYTDRNLSPGQTYTYQVKAVGYAATSAYSLAKTITMSNAPDPSINGLQLWLRSSVGLPISGIVNRWTDQSSNGNDATQGNNAAAPVIVSNVLNGFPAVRFDGIDDVLALPDVLKTSTSAELIIVSKQTPKAGNPPSAGILASFGQDVGYYYSNGVTTHFNGFGLNTPRYSQTFPTAAAAQYHIFSTSIANGTWTERFNGVVTDSIGSATAPFLSTPLIGNLLQGDIVEVMVYSRALTLPERFDLNQHLAAKYALPVSSAPTSPTLNASAFTPTDAELRWSNSDTSGATITLIERRPLNGTFALIATTEQPNSYVDHGLTSGQTYEYRISVRNSGGTSSLSNIVPVTLPATISTPPLTGIKLWLRPSTLSSGPISVWSDSSTNNNNAVQYDPAARPMAVSSAIGGLPVARFVNQQLKLPNILPNGSAGEVFLVMKINTGGWQQFLKLSGQGSIYTGSYRCDDFGRSSVAFFSGGSASSLSQYHIKDISAAPDGTWTDRLNGYSLYSDSTADGTFAPNQSLGSSTFNGDIAEVIIYNRTLSETERNAVNAYFISKFPLPEIVTPATPVLSARAYANWTSLSWNLLSGLHSIAVIERKTGAGSFAEINRVADLPYFQDTNVVGGTTYTYRLKLIGLAGTSGYSNEVVITTPTLPNSGLTLHLDAALGTQGTGPLSTWADQSGQNHNATQTTSALKPQILSNQINGLPVASFDAVDDYLNLTNVLSGTAGEVIAVVLPKGVINKTTQLWDFGSGSGSSFVWGKSIASPPGRMEDFGINQDNLHDTSTLEPNLYHIVDVSAVDTVQEERVNNILINSVQDVPVSFSASAILGSNSAATGRVGSANIAELFVFNRALSADERASLGSYLANKFNLPNITVPGTPKLKAVSSTPTKVSLAWTAGGINENMYYTTTIERSLGASDFVVLGSVDQTLSFEDNTATPNATFNYRVRVTTLKGTSSYSTVSTVTTPLTNTAQFSAAGSSVSIFSGEWLISGSSIVAQSRRGAVNAVINLPIAGLFALDLTVRDAFLTASYHDFPLDIIVDGIPVGPLTIRASGSVAGTGRIILPWAAAGQHTVTIVWHNGAPNSFLKIEGIAVYDPGASWLTSYLNSTFQVDSSPVQTAVSPYTIEGLSARPLFVKLASAVQSSPAGASQAIATKQGLTSQFYGNVILDKTNPVRVTVNEAGGAISVTKDIRWVPLDLTDLNDAKYTVLRDSHILLNETGTPSAALVITAPDSSVQSITILRGETFDLNCAQTGTYNLSLTPLNGSAKLAAKVIVRQVSLSPAPLSVNSYSTTWNPAQLPAEAALETDPGMSLSELSPITRAQQVYGVGRIIARLNGKTGPIIDATSVDLLRVYSDSNGSFSFVDTLTDGTQLIRGEMNLDGPIPANFSATITLWSGLYFSDGSNVRTITAADLNSIGRYTYYYYRPPTVQNMCHNVDLFQGTPPTRIFSY